MIDWFGCADFASCTTPLMDPLLATVVQNRIIADSLLTRTARPLIFLFHPIFHTTTCSNLWKPKVGTGTREDLRLPVFVFKPLASNPDFQCFIQTP